MGADERVEVRSAAELEGWLETNHARPGGVWLVTHKKAAGSTYVPHEQVLDALVAWGWTDGIRRRLDDTRTMQLVSPRRTDVWAESYRLRAERLEREGRMRPPGRTTVERAKRAGTWDALPDVDALEVPADLGAALGDAAGTFAAFPPSTRRNILRWIALAKRPETRAKRIASTAEHAARGEAVRSNG